MKKKLRASYSLLNTWKRGDINGAVDMYLHRSSYTSIEMEEGKWFHDEWENQILQYKEAKIGKTILRFRKPQPEREIIVPYNDIIYLKGRLDCTDRKTIYDFKTGKTDIMDYVNGYQIPFYFLLTDLANDKMTKCDLIHYNQHTDEGQFFRIRRSEYMINKAREYIDSIGPDIYYYFESIGIL